LVSQMRRSDSDDAGGSNPPTPTILNIANFAAKIVAGLKGVNQQVNGMREAERGKGRLWII